MSTPALQLRSRMPRIAEAAVERARLTVVPAAAYPRRPDAVRDAGQPGPAARRDRAAPLQHLDAAGVLRDDQRSRSRPPRCPPASRRCRWSSTSCATRSTSPSGRRRWAWCQPCGSATLRLADGKVLGEPCAAAPVERRCGCRPGPPAKPAILEPARQDVKVPFSSTTPDSTADTGRTSDGRGRSDGRNERHQQPRHRALRPEIPVRPTRPLARAGRSRPRRPRGSLRGSPLFRLRFGFLVIAMVLSVFGARLVQLQGVDPKAYAADGGRRGHGRGRAARPSAATSWTATASRWPPRSTG